MDLFSLKARIGLDTDEYERGLRNAGREAQSFSGNIKQILAGLGVAAALKKAADGVVGLTKTIVNAYGEYEQLVGGVETLFKTSSSKIMQYANDAYKTAGMSANQYMQTATSFAASLISGITSQANKATTVSIDQLQKNLDDRYEAQSRAYDKQYRAAQKNYDKSYRALEKTLDAEITAYQKAADDKIKQINREYKEKLKLVDEEKYNRLKAIDDQIDGLNAETEMEQKMLKGRQQQERIAQLEENVRNARSADEREKAEEELNDYLFDVNQERIQDQRQEEINRLREEKDIINDEYDQKKEQIQEQQQSEVEQLQESQQQELEIMREARDKRLEQQRDSNERALENLKDYYDRRKRMAKRAAEEELQAAQQGASVAVEATDEQYEMAADLVDMAIRDMSDNANKMGTNMESIQAAYQGFSKQNFTMLDNLKLGYGGTKTEMERLLRDAGKLTGKKYVVSNLADIIEAIHAVQENMGITGTTAKEAEHTIQGSTQAMKASWQNLLIAMSTGNGVKEAGTKFVSSVKVWFDNVKPVVKQALRSLIQVARELLPEIMGTILEAIREEFPQFADALDSLAEIFTTAFSAVSDFWTNTLEPILTAIAPYVGGIVATIAAFQIGGKIADIMSVVGQLFAVIKAHPFALIVGAIGAAIGYVVNLYQTNEEARDKINAAFEDIKGFWENTLKPAFEEIWQFVTETLVPALVTAWQEDIQPAIEMAFTAIAGFWTETLQPVLTEIWSFVTETLAPALIKAWREDIQPTIETVFTAISGFWNDTLKPTFEAIYEYVVTDLIPTLIVWWEYHLQPVIEKVFKAIAGFWEDTLKPTFDDLQKFIVETLVPKFTELGEAVTGFVDNNLMPFVDALSSFMSGDGAAVVSWLKGSFIAAWEGIKTEMQAVLNFVTGVFKGDWQSAWDALVTLVSTPFNTLGEILKAPINEVIKLINRMLDKVEGAINTLIEGINSKLHLHFEGVHIGWPINRDVAKFDWSPNLQTVDWGRIALLANGGVLRNGQRAIVGEYAPEYLQVVGGQAVVTPMNTGRFPGGGSDVVVPRDSGRDITIILEVDRQQFARTVYKANNEETQRVGVRLGGAY